MKPACRQFARVVETHLDGELDASQSVEVDRHVAECTACAERIALGRAVRASVRAKARRALASEGLRARVAASMVAEQERVHAADTMTSGPQLLSWRFVAPLTLAAGLALAVGAVETRSHTDAAAPLASVEPQTASAMDLDRMLDQFVEWHARPLPPEVTSENDLPRFEPYVGVPVKPPTLSTFGARLVGARILPVPSQERNAAMLQYTMMNGHRVSVYVYDTRRVAAAPSRLRARVYDSRPVYVGNVHGYSVAAATKRDVGYAIATDLNEDESAELALRAEQ